jgi:hypothetical protein
MQAVIKSISSDEFDLKVYEPENPANFSLTLRIRIGSNEMSGADDFELGVCTPEWLLQNIWEPQWGRHMLIVREYDYSVIERCVNDYIEKCFGDTWDVVAEKIARNFSWEFEDYQD